MCELGEKGEKQEDVLDEERRVVRGDNEKLASKEGDDRIRL